MAKTIIRVRILGVQCVTCDTVSRDILTCDTRASWRRQTCVVGRAEMSRISTRTLTFPLHSQIVCSRVRLASYHCLPSDSLILFLSSFFFIASSQFRIDPAGCNWRIINETAVVDLLMFLLTLYVFISQERKTISRNAHLIKHTGN